jgi:hypothetical protein
MQIWLNVIGCFQEEKIKHISELKEHFEGIRDYT